jgi:hypothetical protein
MARWSCPTSRSCGGTWMVSASEREVLTGTTITVAANPDLAVDHLAAPEDAEADAPPATGAQRLGWPHATFVAAALVILLILAPVPTGHSGFRPRSARPRKRGTRHLARSAGARLAPGNRPRPLTPCSDGWMPRTPVAEDGDRFWVSTPIPRRLPTSKHSRVRSTQMVRRPPSGRHQSCSVQSAASSAADRLGRRPPVPRWGH